MSARYQALSWLYLDLDLNWTKARSIDNPKGMDYVPLAPSFTSIGGISVKFKNGIGGAIRYRTIADRPANETNSVIAKGYFINDLIMNYRFGKFEFNWSIENLFNQEWNEAQFDTESRLFHETSSVSELHFTPGTPLTFKAGFSFHF